MTVKIYVDGRENNPPLDLYKDAGFDVITHKINDDGDFVKLNLPVGDYYITDGEEEIFIELKKGQDFFASLFDGRKDSQMADLSKYPNSYYVMIGDPYDGHYLEYTPERFRDAYPQSITNTLAGFGRKHEHSYRVGFYCFPTIQDFEDFVLYHAKKMKRKQMYRPAITGEEVRRLKKKAVTEVDIEKVKRIGILMQADGVGYDKAKKLIEAFGGSAEAVLRASDKNITTVKGIGKKAVIELRKLGFRHE